ncbi:MAG TPA: hypothetical protein VK666_06560, partial [Chryseolinea sp.]|nr:hypothetical protein [Chryseolinea sp.]
SGLGTVIDMDWSQDDKTLWLLVDDEIKFYGPALTVPELEKDFQEEVISAAVTANRDVFYIVRRPTASGYTERLEFRGRNGASRTISKKSGETYHMASVRLSKDKEHFVLGYNLAQGYEELEKLEFYELNASFPDFTYESSQSYAEAIYDAESAFMVTVTSEFGDAFYLAAEYTLNELGEEDFSKYKYDYSGEIGSVFIDWK